MDSGLGEASRHARLAGLFYLAVIVGGLFAEGFVRGQVVVPGDAAATAASIGAREGLWRAGLAVHLLYLLATVPMSVLLYELLKHAQPSLARMALIFSLVCSTIEAVCLVQIAVPLSLMRDQAGFAAFDPQQIHALGYLATRLFPIGFSFALLFFSGFCLLVGALILRSRVVPRVIGLLMVTAGLAYFANSIAGLIAPDAARLLFPWILLPCLIGELSLALWLLLKGVRLGASEEPPPCLS